MPTVDRPIDNTALTLYMTCPRAYYFAMILHRRAAPNAALLFGRAWHELLKAYYLGADLDAACEAVFHDWPTKLQDFRTPGRLLVEFARYKAFWDEYPNERDGTKTVGYPTHPLVEIATQVHKPEVMPLPYAGRIDRIIELDGLYYVEDHKTTSLLRQDYWDQFSLSNQMMGYTWQAQQLLPAAKLVGVRINLTHILTNTTAFYRQIFTFSPGRIAEWEQNTARWMHRLIRDTEAGDFPGHYGDNGCSQKYGRCEYCDVCKLPERFRMRRLESEFDYNPWNPIKEQRDESKVVPNAGEGSNCSS